jgi:hypothetical protein
MKESNIEIIKKERSNIVFNKNPFLEKEKSRVILREAKQKNLEKDKQSFSPLYDIMKMSEFLNHHTKNLEQDLNETVEIRFGNNEEEKDLNYLEVIKEFKKEKRLDNYMFFYNGKEFVRNPPEKVKKGIQFKQNNNLAEKNTAAYRVNPITKCKINFSDDENSDVNHNSDIDIYL